MSVNALGMKRFQDLLVDLKIKWNYIDMLSNVQLGIVDMDSVDISIPHDIHLECHA